MFCTMKAGEKKGCAYMTNWKVGDTCYFISNGMNIVEGKIASVQYEFCIVKFADNAALSLRCTKLYHSQEEAEKGIIRKPGEMHKSPYDYLH